MNFLHFLLGKTCIFCGKTVDPASDGICPDCIEAIREKNLERKAEEQTAVLSLYRYEEPLREGLHRFKYNGVADLGKYCGIKLANLFRELGLKADLVTCVPRAKDGMPRIYNQSEIIAKSFSKALSIPFDGTLLRKRSGIKSQTECINAHARLRNAQSAFRKGQQKTDLTGKSIVLIDDLYTTGATAQTCAEILRKMGAEKVQICTAMQTYEPPAKLKLSTDYIHKHYDFTVTNNENSKNHRQ